MTRLIFYVFAFNFKHVLLRVRKLQANNLEFQQPRPVGKLILKLNAGNQHLDRGCDVKIDNENLGREMLQHGRAHG